MSQVIGTSYSDPKRILMVMHVEIILVHMRKTKGQIYKI